MIVHRNAFATLTVALSVSLSACTANVGSPPSPGVPVASSTPSALPENAPLPPPGPEVTLDTQVPAAAPPEDERPAVPPPEPTTPITTCRRAAVVLLLDRSGSMSGVPIEMAKTAAKDALGLLGTTDCFGVIAFDSEPTRVVRITQVTDRPAIEARITKITAGGGTAIANALRLAQKEILAAVSAKRRAVVLLTDGQSSHDGIKDIVTELEREHVQVSTIGLGSGVDDALLRMIASNGNGRAHFVRDVNALPGTMVKEVGIVVR